jgi:hypothetical protein
MQFIKPAFLFILLASLAPQVALADPKFFKETSGCYYKLHEGTGECGGNDKGCSRKEWDWSEHLIAKGLRAMKGFRIETPYIMTREKLIRFMYTKDDAEKILSNLTKKEKDITINYWGIIATEDKFGNKLGDLELDHKNDPLYYYRTNKGAFYGRIYYFREGNNIYNLFDEGWSPIQPSTENANGMISTMERLRYEMQLASDKTLFPITGNDFDGNPMPARDLPVANLRSGSNVDPVQISPSVLRATIASTKWYFGTSLLDLNKSGSNFIPFNTKASVLREMIAANNWHYQHDSTPEEFLKNWNIAVKTYQTAGDKRSWLNGLYQIREIPWKLRQIIRIYMEEMATPEDKQKLQDYIQKCVLDKAVI